MQHKPEYKKMTSEPLDMTARRKLAFEELSKRYETMTAMAAAFGITVPAVAKWKRFGIPAARVPYFMLKYPKLEAWKGLPRGV